MARSEYVYIVTAVEGGCADILAAFTVKHELVSWLRANPASDHRVTRVRDGHDPHPTIIDITELTA
ncbi:hypothetical protein IU449_26780 [Nocardia higoensis]|uniref:Uncharacterized protein n=1 Tax=Nocardia higoensis TaxID=228599 RepID=A0ABS0DI16_9NOCA|nr:hypothetical protein [Nocardia higoensis]MBF6358105.1 hypothetical protein [Nocardia higoensis]